MARILAVDDDPETRALLDAVLSSAGHEVVPVEDGPTALGEVAGGGFDVILLDVMMPGMDGYEVLARLKADPATAPIPVVMVTARSEGRGILVERATGAAGHVAKPFRIEEIEEALERALEPSTEHEDLQRALGQEAARSYLDVASLFDPDATE